MYDLKNFYGPNAGYVLDLYERYNQDPSSVDAEARALFASWSPDAQEAVEVGARPAPVPAAPFWQPRAKRFAGVSVKLHIDSQGTELSRPGRRCGKREVQ